MRVVTRQKRFEQAFLLLSMLSAVCLAVQSASGCFMLPVTYEGTIRQTDHEAVILHHGGREELVLRINYEITGAAMPANFAWVITVPNEPDAYAVADPKLFEDMFNLPLERPGNAKRRRGGGGGGGGFDDDIELGQPVRVGPYDIQPVRGVGANALNGLNAWLQANGFPTEAPAHMKYFVDNQFTFLCIKIVASSGEKTVGSDGMLPPLHLSFASPKPYCPVRFSSRQGVFDVNFHVLTPRKFDYSASHRVLQQINWDDRNAVKNRRLSKRKMPTSLKALFAKSKLKIDQEIWFYNYIRGEQVNRGQAIATWTNDVFLNGVPLKYRATQPLPPDRVGAMSAPASGSLLR